MRKKVVNKNEVIRFVMLGLALCVFFLGPRYVQADIADDVDDTIKVVVASKALAKIAKPVLTQLEECKAFAKENTNSISIASVKMSAVNWLALLILISGLFTPIILKYIESKKPGDA